MTTESLMIHAIKRGLLLNDFNDLSVGMILDYINQYDGLYNETYAQDEKVRNAKQEEFNNF